MDRRIKHGISKRNHVQTHQKFKKSFRYFLQEERDASDEVLSGSQLCSSKKTSVHCVGSDVTKALLEIVSRNAKLTGPDSTKSKHEISSAKAIRQKSEGAISESGDGSVSDKTSRRNVQKVAEPSIKNVRLVSSSKRKTSNGRNSKGTTGNMLYKPKANQIMHTKKDRETSFFDTKSSTQEIEEVSNNKFCKNSSKFEKYIKESNTSDKTSSQSKRRSMKITTSEKFYAADHGDMRTQETHANAIESLDVSLNSSAVKKVEYPGNYSNKKRISLNAQNLLTEKKSGSEMYSDIIRNKNTNVKSVGDLSHNELETNNLRKKTKKKSISKYKNVWEQESNAYRESNDANPLEHIGMALPAVNGEQTSVNNKVKQTDKGCMYVKVDSDPYDRKLEHTHSEKFEENNAEPEEQSLCKNEIYAGVLQGTTSINDTYCARNQEKNNKKRKKNKQKATNSSPVLIETSGSIPINSLDEQMSDGKKCKIRSSFRYKSDKPCLNVTSTHNWGILGENSELLTISDYNDDIHMRNEMQTDSLYMPDHETKESSCSQSTAKSDDEFKENETADRKILDESIDKRIQLSQNSEDSVPHSVTNNDSFQYKLFGVSESEIIMALPPSSSIFFNGVLKVKVLVGSVEVLGCKLDSATTVAESCRAYSSKICLLRFRACVTKGTFSSEEEYWKLVKENLTKELHKHVLHQVPAFTSLIFLEKVTDPLIPFLSKFSVRNVFSKVFHQSNIWQNEVLLNVQFLKPPDRTSLDDVNTSVYYRQLLQWNSISKSLLKRKQGGLRVVVCGGKKVGKSTFLRFLVNRMLNKFKKVLYIDFDPGQSEFTPPGCISAVIVENPLLGPGFTHLKRPEQSVYLGEVNVSDCAFVYMQCVQYIYDGCCSQPELSHLPWFINTMGFPKGLGLNLTISIVKMITPTDVIGIKSVHASQNFDIVMQSTTVQNYHSTFDSLLKSKEGNLSYSYHETRSAATNKKIMTSQFSREISLLSYFSCVTSPPFYSLLEPTCHVLSFSGLKLYVKSKGVKFSDYLFAMNAGLVALCDVGNYSVFKPKDPEYPEILKDLPMCQCLGFGIVRCIDIQKKIFFIISPIEPEIFKSVNCLILGKIKLPTSVYTLQDSALGNIPYVIYGESKM